MESLIVIGVTVEKFIDFEEHILKTNKLLLNMAANAVRQSLSTGF